jgi:hypothetical protein
MRKEESRTRGDECQLAQLPPPEGRLRRSGLAAFPRLRVGKRPKFRVLSETTCWAQASCQEWMDPLVIAL